jgi:hypothetical protein
MNHLLSFQSLRHTLSTGFLVAATAATCALAGCSSDEGTVPPEPPAPGVEKKPVGEVMLEAPKTAELGWQFAVEPFEVPSGEEAQNCYFFEVPYDVPVYASRITMAQNDGSHHMNIFRIRTQTGLKAVPGQMVHNGECFNGPNWKDWPLVANSQTTGIEDWALPPGVAHKFAPREVLMVQSHFVNATTQKTPLGGKVSINFERLADDKVTAELGTAFATNQAIQICPGEHDKSFEATCKFAPKNPVTVVAANGHFHSRGKRFTMSVFDPTSDTQGDPFYLSKTWNEPPFTSDLSVTIPQGGGVRYACDYTVGNDSCGDPANQCCFTFGPHVDEQEHCNAFIYYYPKNDTDVNCF